MTAALGDLLDELADIIQAVCDNANEDVQVVGRREFNPSPPTVDIYPADPARDSTTQGFQDAAGELLLVVRARVTTVDNFAGQDLLLRFMDEEDPIGIAAAVQDDQTLNGFASSVIVEAQSGYVQYLEGGAEGGSHLGCEWRVRVVRAYS